MTNSDPPLEILTPTLVRDLVDLSLEIHGDPELAYEEVRAADRICNLLEKYGHQVERPLGGLATAFRSRVGPGTRTVALLAEYDALPGVGHGCGHNLIAMTNVGAYLAVAAATDAGDLPLGVEIIGTPAEERGGGKVDLLEAGVFDEVAIALSTHPTSQAEWTVGSTTIGIVGKRVVFHGALSHAATAPERGRNALNGVIQLFNGVNAWRQHMPADTRVHGIITDGGSAPNVVPARAEAVFGVRARDVTTLDEISATFDAIAQGAAVQTGTTVEILDEGHRFEPVRVDESVGDVLLDELARRDVRPARGTALNGSTDLGNVSQRVASNWIRFPAQRERIAGHSEAMRDACGSPQAHETALLVTDALAATVLRLARGRA